MIRFNYIAVDPLGKEMKGSMDMATKKEVIALLRAQGLMPISVSEAGAMSRASASFQKSSAASKANKGKSGKVKLEDIALFCRQISTLVNAGVSLLDSVEDVSNMTQSARLGYILKEIASDLRGGFPLSDSMKKHKEFSKTLTSMVEVGEKSGQLAKVLSDLAEYLEENVKLLRKIKSASTYPMVIGCFFIVVLLALVLGIIPRFEEMFKSFGADLPLPTKLVMNVSNFMIDNLIIITLSVAAFFIGFRMFKKSKGGRIIYDRTLFKIPIFGKTYLKIVLARFFQTLSTLVKSGVDIVSSLEISINVVDNVYIEGLLKTVRQNVLGGNPLGDELAKLPIFPLMVTRMTAVGEKSGQLDAMFDKITDYYNDEVDAVVASMSSIIEPVLIVGLGFIVGIAVTAMYLPIFSLASAMMAGSGG
ncbi:MAG: type II secretion system F family protein [Endomicrobium sp.]|jgi:type IV pilus assembly protein PilC|nr:type II secretion system F family protein [Endomicrobium sp.]